MAMVHRKKRSSRPAGRRVGKKMMRRRARPAITRIRAVGIPDKMIVKLPYVDLQSAGNVASVSSWSKIYNVNAPWDPESFAFNSSATYLKEYAGIYAKYRVFAVSYDVTIANTAPNSITSGCLAFGSPDNLPIAGYPDTYGFRFSRPYTTSYYGSGKDCVRLKGHISLPKVLGLTSEQYRTNDNFIGETSATNPMDLVQMILIGQNVNTSQNAGAQLHVRLTFHVELFGRMAALGSTPPDDTPSA